MNVVLKIEEIPFFRIPVFRRNPEQKDLNCIEVIVITNESRNMIVRLPNTIWAQNLMRLLENPSISRMNKISALFDTEAKDIRTLSYFFRPIPFLDGYRHLIHIITKCQ